jgi:ribonuclease H / adenosylcobalamin/alpha-ribazole phosphatase
MPTGGRTKEPDRVRIVHLVRHGSHAELGRALSGRSEIALNPQGLAEADRLADRLARTPIASLHTSPRRRARQTVAPLARAMGAPVQVTAALDEIDFGRFTGQSFATLDGDPDWFRWNAERATARCPEGETMAEAVARAAGYLDALPDTAFPALCVTHCDVIRGLVADRLGMGLARLFALDCDPASCTTLEWDAGTVRLVELNLRP